MARLFLCLCVCVCAGVVSGQVASLCRPNERLLMCGGCHRTCLDPVPDCKGVCRPGCFCEKDQVRNATGHCVRLSECPPLPPSSKLETSEPRPTSACPPNEEYKFCEPCNKTCANPNPICPPQCSRGCYCKPPLVRDRDGKCVKLEECSNSSANEIPHHSQPEKPVGYQDCGANKVFKECSNCERSCSNPNPQCPAQCSRGCFCKDGFYKAPNGDCVQLEQCPKAEESFSAAHEPSIEDCAADEKYFSCGWCEPSCSQPAPECPPRVCLHGCLCRPPLLRHRSGHCVESHQCKPQRCLDPNEEYVCRYGCEARCDNRTCVNRPRRCRLGCYCAWGLLRHSSGRCVARNECN